VSLLLDTHAALWLVQGDTRLGDGVTARIAGLRRDELCISDLLLLELSLLISKGRVVVDESPGTFLRDLAARFHILPIHPAVAALAPKLPLPQADPFDRVFVATAKYHEIPIVTRDAAIRDSGIVETIW
jgi:PIN domain nuclease of toxin-antitoxin system